MRAQAPLGEPGGCNGRSHPFPPAVPDDGKALHVQVRNLPRLAPHQGETTRPRTRHIGEFQLQTKLMSLLESLSNVAVGMVVSLFGQVIVSHWYNLPLSFAQNINIVLFFTVLSVIRSYVIRRWYDRRITTWKN